jgi:arylsulfatase A-like enzyme
MARTHYLRGIADREKNVLRTGLVVLALLVAFMTVASSQKVNTAQAQATKSNFVFILADDMRLDDLANMPKTKQLLGDGGMTFNNAYVPYGVCCPSRASIMRGQYAHNHGVHNNDESPDGGWQAYVKNGDEQDNIATRMQADGYSTALIGKYLNGYDGSVRPPGWTYWFARYKGHYFDWYARENDSRRHYGKASKDYETDVITQKTKRFIADSVSQNKPFMAYVTPGAPHFPQIPAPRDEGTFTGQEAPNKNQPSFNEADVSDKPSFIQDNPSLTSSDIAQIDQRYVDRQETLQALDDLVEAVYNKVDSLGKLNNTYFVFFSDNGWEQGEHRIAQSKAQAYEESVHMPLLIKGPGIPAGSSSDKLVLNTDFFPTFAKLAGIAQPPYIDGRPIDDIWKGTATTWRNAFLLERWSVTKPERSFFGVGTSEPRKYVEYQNGEAEYYDRQNDPYEVNSLYNGSSGIQPADLAARLQALKNCAGSTCRSAEDGT